MTKKHSYNYIKKQFEKEGYELLTNHYENNHQKLDYICPKGHRHSINWNNWQQGQRCPICADNKKRHTYKYIKEQIENKGYSLLSEKYKNVFTKSELQCRHIYKVTYHSFQQGHRCPVCARKQKLTYEYIKRQVEKEGYKLLSKEYKNSRIKLQIQCLEGHKFEMKWNNFQQEYRCPICQANFITSKAEKEIAKIIEDQSIKIKRNDRTQITNPLTGYNLELDIYIPSLKKAIEFNGRYWHSFKHQKTKDKIKIKQCAKKNINLLVIKEQDWLDDKTYCVKKIKEFCTGAT
jgi:hypothetical protein